MIMIFDNFVRTSLQWFCYLLNLVKINDKKDDKNYKELFSYLERKQINLSKINLMLYVFYLFVNINLD